MKAKSWYAILVLCLMCLMGGQAQAQTTKIFNDTMIWFKNPVRIIGNDPVFKGDAVFDLSPQVRRSAKPVSASMSKSLNIPSKAKRLPSPITVKRKGKCYKIGCDKRGCSSCQLFWLDKNGDNKVQPRKELRCICKENRACELRGKQVDCQK